MIQVAARLAESIRSCDFVARYGGDEFVVIASNASHDEFRARLEQFTTGRYVANDGVINYRGASVGIAASAPDETDVEKLPARANAAMYETKKSRRDRLGLN